MKNTEDYLIANWKDKPDNVSAVTTLRTGGVSRGDFTSYNLATHVNDDATAVEQNRNKLADDLSLPSSPIWLEQIHSNEVIVLDQTTSVGAPPKADASVTTEAGIVCAVLTADCLPVFFCNRQGTEVAVAHAGWRGLHAGVLTNTVKAMRSPVAEIMASLGPAIGSQAFEVGEEVYDAFVAKNSANKAAFSDSKPSHYYCDIYQLAKLELSTIGIATIGSGDYCTYNEAKRFYSFRKQPITGRMASLIWLE